MMIEPKNTMMPLPAAPAQAEASQGDGIAFGEMLAQSLGMAATIDPNAVQQIAPNSQQHQQPDAEAGGVPSGEPEVAAQANGNQPAPADRFMKPGVNRNHTPGLPPREGPPVADPSLPGNGGGPSRTAKPIIVTAPIDPAQPVDPTVGLTPTRPGNGIWKPVLTGTPDPATSTTTSATPVTDVALPVVSNGAAVPPNDGVPSNGAPNNLPTDAPVPPALVEVAAAEVRPVNRRGNVPVKPGIPTLPPQPSPTSETAGNVVLPPDPTGVHVARNLAPDLVQPAVAQPNPSRTKLDPKFPIDPAPPVQIQTTTPVVADPSPANVVWPSATAQPRVNLTPETTVRFDSPKVGVTKAAPAATPAVAEAAPGAATAAVTMAANDAPQTQFAAEVASLADSGQRSALAERVLRAVELQANQPPPRTMVVELPEVEGLRLIVSVRAGGQVHVVPTTGSAAPPSFEPFMDELSGVLADRGFVMTGDGRERGSNPRQEEQQQQPSSPMQRPSFRRPTPGDNDLRI